LLRRRRCNTTSSNTTSVPTSSLGGVASVSQLPPQDGDHFFPLSSNHVPLGTYSGTCPRSQGAAFYGTYVHVACPRSQRAAQFCGGCLNEVDRVIHQSMCSLPYRVRVLPSATTSRLRSFLPNAEARARERASAAFVLLCDLIFAPTDGIATVCDS